MRSFWEMRGAALSLVHFRKPIRAWAHEHLVSPRQPLHAHLQRRFVLRTRGAHRAADGIFGHVNKKLSGLAGFYMAGQWVEPG